MINNGFKLFENVPLNFVKKQTWSSSLMVARHTVTSSSVWRHEKQAGWFFLSRKNNDSKLFFLSAQFFSSSIFGVPVRFFFVLKAASYLLKKILAAFFKILVLQKVFFSSSWTFENISGILLRKIAITVSAFKKKPGWSGSKPEPDSGPEQNISSVHRLVPKIRCRAAFLDRWEAWTWTSASSSSWSERSGECLAGCLRTCCVLIPIHSQ